MEKTKTRDFSPTASFKIPVTLWDFGRVKKFSSKKFQKEFDKIKKIFRKISQKKFCQKKIQDSFISTDFSKRPMPKSSHQELFWFFWSEEWFSPLSQESNLINLGFYSNLTSINLALIRPSLAQSHKKVSSIRIFKFALIQMSLVYV